MKMLKKIYTLIIMILLLLPMISFAFAADTKEARYGGLNNNDIYVYLTTFNKKPLEKYYEKEYMFDGWDEETASQMAEDFVDYIFDLNRYDKDIEAIKYNILRVETNKEEVGNNKGRRVWYNMYISEDRDANEWELKDHIYYGYIMEFQMKLYKDAIKDSITPFSGFDAPFIAKGINWKELASELDEDFEDYDYYNIYGYKNDAGAKNLNDGIQTYFKVILGTSSFKTERFRTTSRYTSKGVLYYYEWTYGNEIIAKLELEQSFYSEFWVLLLVIFIIAAAIFLIILKREIKQ